MTTRVVAADDVGYTDVNTYSDRADESLHGADVDLDGADEDADGADEEADGDADGRFCARQQLGNGRRLRSLP